MTKQTEEELNALEQGNQTADTTETDEGQTEIDNDPMLAGLREAEAEDGEEAGEGEGQTEGEGQQPAAGAKTETTPKTEDKTKQVMIPKSRLDEVLSERDLLRDQVGYLRGLNDARTEMIKGKPADAAQTEKPAKTDTQGDAVDTVEAAIEAAEKKKLELADKFDNGEITSRQWKEQEIAIDKEIRTLSAKRIDDVRAESRRTAQAVVSASQTQAAVETTALTLQQQHPNIAVIDSLLPGVRDGVWNAITEQAAQNLAAKGINVKDGTPASHLALINERAKLTDDLDAFIPGFKGQVKSTPAGEKSLSDTARGRQAKIDLANSQPPATADLGRGTEQTGELSESDIENMTEDQLADLLQKAPNLLKKYAG